MVMSELNVAVWGASGFAGQELVGILQGHPDVSNIRKVGREDPIWLEDSETAFLALPHGDSGRVAGNLAVSGNVVIDLSGDLRFPTPEEYEVWYDRDHPAPELLPAPYALPELYRHEIDESRVISMPGCYPTATLLGAVPLVEGGLLKPDSMLAVSALSGVSGRGKKPTDLTHFMTMSGNTIPYNSGRAHRHVGEIERFLGGRSIVFSPKVVPIERGMLVETISQLEDGVTAEDVSDTFREAYDEEPFVKVLPEGENPDIHMSVRSDGCYIGYTVMRKMLLVISSIDNLRKGAASQAVQAFNIVHDLPETTGLKPIS